MIDVNLLPEQKVSSLRVNRAKRIAIIGTVGFSVVWFVGLVSLFIYSQVLGSQVQSLSTRKQAAESRLANLDTQKNNIVALKQKISGIGYLQKNIFEFPNALAYVLKIFPQGVDITSISVADNAQVVFAGKSANSALAATFLAQLGQDQTLKYPTLAGFHYDDGQFVFNVNAYYGQPIKKPTTN